MKNFVTQVERYLPNATKVAVVSVTLLGISSPVAHAFGLLSLFGFSSLWDFVSEWLAILVNLLLSITSWILAMAGFLLNLSINLTMNIRDFVNATSAIYSTWTAIRDISSLFIIFGLLYAAFQMILGLKGPKFGETIKNIVIAGVLINFSFFFAGLGIDFSNIISGQIYNAMVPTGGTTAAVNNISQILDTNDPAQWTKLISAPGIADIFSQSLQVTAIYKNTAFSKDSVSHAAAPIKIIMMGVTGIVIEIMAALSFTAAAAAFVIRFVLLIFLLAFSPIWFAAKVVPKIDEYAKKWWDTYYSMLVFMPVYLLLMYLALNVLSTNKMFSGGFATNLVSGAGGDHWYSNFLVLGLNAFIVIFMLNIPLVAAISMGGVATSWIKKSGITGGAIWKRVGGFAGTHTVGALAGRAEKGLENTQLGNKVLGREIRDVTTGALAKNKMGGPRSYEERVKLQKEVGQKSKEIERAKELDEILSGKKNGYELDGEGNPRVSTLMNQMNGKEKLAIIGKNIKDEAALKESLKHLNDSDFEAIKKSDDLSEIDKDKIKRLRREALKDAISNGQTTVVTNMIKNMDSKDLIKPLQEQLESLVVGGSAETIKNINEAIKKTISNMDGKDLLKLGDATLKNNAVIENLKPSQLKTLAEEGLNEETKVYIGNKISTMPTHKAKGWINKKENKDEWTSHEEVEPVPI